MESGGSRSVHMRSFGILGLLGAMTALLLAGAAAALEVPALKGRVNDYAGMLAPDTD